MLEENQIIELTRRGDVNAFGQIIEYYQVPLIRYLERMTGDRELARDLAQDTFLQAYLGILKNRSEISFKAWLYRIATNNALQYHRRRRILAFIPFTRLGKALDLLESPGESRDEKIIIEEALKKVPEEQRTCLILHFGEGFKYQEIAITLGISEEAVGKRVARGKQSFLRHYGGRGR